LFCRSKTKTMLTISFSKRVKQQPTLSNQEKQAISQAIQARFRGKAERVFSDKLVVNTSTHQYTGALSSGNFEVFTIHKLKARPSTAENKIEKSLSDLLTSGEITQNGSWYYYQNDKFLGKKAIEEYLNR
jgi:hypothetical protein